MKGIFLVQAFFFFGTGLWPLLHIKSFIKVTGPKYDVWLVKTVGVLVTAIAIGLVISYFKENISIGVASIAMLSALFLTGIDLYYTAKGRISRIYLFDAVIEVLFVINAIVFLL
jgi:hypothetical protein